jgi:hypothetical protein
MAQEQDTQSARSFAVFLAQLANGAPNSDLSVELQKLTDGLHTEAINRNNHAKGKLTFTLALDVAPNGVVAIHYDVTRTMPKSVRPEAVAFATKDGSLSFESPKQPSLPFRDVSAPAAAHAVVETPATPAKQV